MGASLEQDVCAIFGVDPVLRGVVFFPSSVWTTGTPLWGIMQRRATSFDTNA